MPRRGYSPTPAGRGQFNLGSYADKKVDDLGNAIGALNLLSDTKGQFTEIES